MQAKWIWKTQSADDEYVNFVSDFEYKGGNCKLWACADGMMSVFLNGERVFFGKYPDFPHYRVAEEIDLTDKIKKGINRLAFLVWHIGADFSTYTRGEAGLIFEVRSGDEVLAASGKDVLCRLAPDFISHRGYKITCQLGFTFRYDAEKADGWKEAGKPLIGFTESSERSATESFHFRPVKKLQEGELLSGRIVQQGTFTEKDYPTAGERLYRSAMSFVPPEEMFKEKRMFMALDRPVSFSAVDGDGVFILIDLGREEAGFPFLEFTVEQACEVEVGFGEHINDGRVRSSVGGRNFSFEYRAKAGKNRFCNDFRRLGGRYLQLFFHTHSVKDFMGGVIPVYYPITRKPREISDRLFKKIYDVSVRTLELCMHDHYEDTPWREQSFYTMDSRNQMLFGYDVFEETDFARAGLRLFAEAGRDDGLLTLCAPMGKTCDYPIPYFSLMYVVEVAEYYAFTGDRSLVDEVYRVLKRILSVFEKKITEKDVIDNFADPQYWNFYEWTDGMSGGKGSSLDAPLNGFFLFAAEKFAEMCEKTGHEETGKYYLALADRVRKGCRKEFFNSDRGLFKTYSERKELDDHFSELTNSLFVLTGVAQGETARKICDMLVEKDNGMVAISASHSIFKYDALMCTDKEKYAPYILQEVEDRYSKMLYAGATSFWETDNGAEDFDHAGSLCHGWSSVPIYVFNRLNVK